jgi:peroxiredoxin
VPELDLPTCDASVRDFLGAVIKVDKHDIDLKVFIKGTAISFVNNAVSQKRITNRETAEIFDTVKSVYSVRNSVCTFAYDSERKYYSTMNKRSYREYFHDGFVMYI